MEYSGSLRARIYPRKSAGRRRRRPSISTPTAAETTSTSTFSRRTIWPGALRYPSCEPLSDRSFPAPLSNAKSRSCGACHKGRMVGRASCTITITALDLLLPPCASAGACRREDREEGARRTWPRRALPQLQGMQVPGLPVRKVMQPDRTCVKINNAFLTTVSFYYRLISYNSS